MGNFTDWKTQYTTTKVGDISYNGVPLRQVSNNYEKLPDAVYNTSLTDYNQIPAMFKSTDYSKPAVSTYRFIPTVTWWLGVNCSCWCPC